MDVDDTDTDTAHATQSTTAKWRNERIVSPDQTWLRAL